MDLTPNYKKAEEKAPAITPESTADENNKLDEFFKSELGSSLEVLGAPTDTAPEISNSNGKSNAVIPPTAVKVEIAADDKPDKSEKVEKVEKGEKVEKFEKHEKSEKTDKLEKAERPLDKVEKVEKKEKREKVEERPTPEVAKPFKIEEPVLETPKVTKTTPEKVAAEKPAEATKPLPSLPSTPPPPPVVERLVSPVKDLPPSMPAQTVTPFVQQIAESLKQPPVVPPVQKTKVELSPFVSAEQQSNPQLAEFLTGLLRFMVEKRASDLHLRAGTPIIFRIDGNLMAFDKNILSADMARDILFHMLPQRQRKIFEAKNEADFSFAVHNVGRFRGNAFRQRGSVAVVLRQIPTTIPNFAELNLPTVMEKFCKLSRGLVLICGPTGSGKSTALAAMIQQINAERSEHIVTIEDPIEFLHKDNKSIISQRELGTDTISFSEALKHVLRQDPDVVLLGEMRDLETTSTAITAAQTGHLVLSTLHTTDAVQTINRVVDLYPPHQQQQVRYQLADVLKGVVCQRLISHARGVGRIPTCEVLVVTALVRKAIAENKMTDVQEAIRQGQYYGMQSFHQSLLKLYKEGQIKLEEALEAASNPEELMMAIRGITSGTEGA